MLKDFSEYWRNNNFNESQDIFIAEYEGMSVTVARGKYAECTACINATDSMGIEDRYMVSFKVAGKTKKIVKNLKTKVPVLLKWGEMVVGDGGEEYMLFVGTFKDAS